MYALSPFACFAITGALKASEAALKARGLWCHAVPYYATRSGIGCIISVHMQQGLNPSHISYENELRSVNQNHNHFFITRVTWFTNNTRTPLNHHLVSLGINWLKLWIISIKPWIVSYHITFSILNTENRKSTYSTALAGTVVVAGTGLFPTAGAVRSAVTAHGDW